ncbi:hypothetical protein Tco_0721253 [Tanacetum coccineum]
MDAKASSPEFNSEIYNSKAETKALKKRFSKKEKFNLLNIAEDLFSYEIPSANNLKLDERSDGDEVGVKQFSIDPSCKPLDDVLDINNEYGVMINDNDFKYMCDYLHSKDTPSFMNDIAERMEEKRYKLVGTPSERIASLNLEFDDWAKANGFTEDAIKTQEPADLVVDNRSDLVKVVAAPVVGQRTYRDARGPIYDVSVADVRQAPKGLDLSEPNDSGLKLRAAIPLSSY